MHYKRILPPEILLTRAATRTFISNYYFMTRLINLIMIIFNIPSLIIVIDVYNIEGGPAIANYQRILTPYI